MGSKVLLVLLTALVFTTQSAAQQCQGENASIIGTDGDETITGTDGDDVIAALGGDDIVDGAGGNDLICGGTGDDDLVGGEDDDLLDGGEGNDVCDGDVGVDQSQNCESVDNVNLDFRAVTLYADDGTALRGALYVPEGMTRRVAILATHGSTGTFETAVPRIMGAYGELYDFTVLAMNRRDASITRGGPSIIYDDTIDDLAAGMEFLERLGFSEVFLVGHSQGTAPVVHYPRRAGDNRVLAVGHMAGTVSGRIPINISPDLQLALELVEAGEGDVVTSFPTLGIGDPPVSTPNRVVSYYGPESLNSPIVEIPFLNLPIFVIHVDGDIITRNVIRIYEAALEAGLETRYVLMPNAGVDDQYPELPSWGVAHGFIGSERQLMVETADWLFLTVAQSNERVPGPEVPAQEADDNFVPLPRVDGERSAKADALVTLDGTPSVDLDGEIVSYEWSQSQGPPVGLNGSDSPQVSFTMPPDGSRIGVALKITDNAGAAATSEVVVSPTSVSIDNGGGGSGLLLCALIFIVATGGGRHRLRLNSRDGAPSARN